MNGREHVFWAVAIFSTITLANTAIIDYGVLKWYLYVVMAFLVLISIFLNDVANTFSSLEKGAKSKDKVPTKHRKLHVISLSMRMGAYFIILGTAGFSSILSMPSVPSFLFVLIGYTCAIAGACLPDYDAFIEIKYHRDPFTHSALIPVITGTWAILVCPVLYLPLMIPVSGFLVGYATHLFADHFPSSSTFIDGISAWRKKASAPGNIRHIKKSRQASWLLLNYAMIIPVIIFALGRMPMAGFLDFIPAWNGTSIMLEPGSIGLIIYAIACTLVILAMAITWRDREK